MATYDGYIKVSGDFESVIDFDTDNRSPDKWKGYLVHEDMAKALSKICESLKYEDSDKRRSFWIHGTYGTGKSYAALVVKHLFTEPIENIQEFLSKPKLAPYKEQFLSERKKGKFLVVTESGVNDIRNSTQFLFRLERSIRSALKAQYGDRAYYGVNSLIARAKEAVNDKSINWQDIYDTSNLNETYSSASDFIEQVRNGNIAACNEVVNIYANKGWGFTNTGEAFKNWIGDVIEGNNLSNTGIIVIWDEFTQFLTHDNVGIIQELSEFCKVQPFFMFLVVHRDTGTLAEIGGKEAYERIVHRFHELEFKFSEAAAYDLISNAIIVNHGMEEQWGKVCNDLLDSLGTKFINDCAGIEATNPSERIRHLCPIHPYTMKIISIIASNYSASQRSVFRFLQDEKNKENKVGFTYYISNYGYDGWRWLTADFLWDYFFLSDSDISTNNFSKEQREAYRHYNNYKDGISDEKCMRIFKCAMLLIAVASYDNINNEGVYMSTSNAAVASTKDTLVKCFKGVLDENVINAYIDSLVQNNMLRLDESPSGKVQLHLPFIGGNGNDLFENERAKIKSENTRYSLFSKSGTFSGALEDKINDKNEAISKRLSVCVAADDNRSITTRLQEIEAELGKNPYKYGVLGIVVDSDTKYKEMQGRLSDYVNNDHIAICLFSKPLTDVELDKWYDKRTNSELAKGEGKQSDSRRYSDEGDSIVTMWADSSASSPLYCVIGNTRYPQVVNLSDFLRDLSRVVYSTTFKYAPENVVEMLTVYKKMNYEVVLSALKKSEPRTSQISAISDALKRAEVWDASDIDEVIGCSANPGQRAISAVAKLIKEKLSEGRQISLQDLWDELQREPYGFYNCMVCGYILGFIFRFYLKSDYTWNSFDNNTFAFTDENVAKMICDMCDKKAVNQYVTPGSDTWRKFKPYVQKIFNLDDNEASNPTEAVKFISKQCTDCVGVPFWALKYLPSDNFGGDEAKAAACNVIDLFCEFMGSGGDVVRDKESVMSDVIAAFSGNGKLRQVLHDLYFNQAKAYNGFSNFVVQKCEPVERLRDKIGLKNRDIFDAIHSLMQGAVATWTESDVESKLGVLCLQYRIVAALNDAVGCACHSIDDACDEIRPALSMMKVPGRVIEEELDYSWISALKAMHSMTLQSRQTIPQEKMEEYAMLLERDAKAAWGNATAPNAIFRQYLINKNIDFSDEEIPKILECITPSNYDTQAVDFRNKVDGALEKVTYNRNIIKLKELWKTQSGFNTVSEWCNRYCVPIQWVVQPNEQEFIDVLRKIEQHNKVDPNTLGNAVNYLSANKITALTDSDKIYAAFFDQVGSGYRHAFDGYKDILFTRLKTDRILGGDVYSWANNVGKIRSVIDSFLKDKYFAEAKTNVLNMNEKQLRERVIKMLDDNPDLYTNFLK